MKLMMMMISLVMTAAMAHATTGNTGDDNVNVLIKRTFEKEFPNARYASWQKVPGEGIYAVRFVYHDQPFVSYLDEEGNMLAVIRNRDTKDLPIMASKAIKKKYGEFRIFKIEELTTPDDLSYVIAMQKDNLVVIIRVYPNGLIDVVRKEKIKKAAF